MSEPPSIAIPVLCAVASCWSFRRVLPISLSLPGNQASLPWTQQVCTTCVQPMSISQLVPSTPSLPPSSPYLPPSLLSLPPCLYFLSLPFPQDKPAPPLLLPHPSTPTRSSPSQSASPVRPTVLAPPPPTSPPIRQPAQSRACLSITTTQQALRAGEALHG